MKDLENKLLLLFTLAGLVITGIHPHDHLTWLLEVLPVFIGLAILIPTYRSFPLTPLLYRLFFIHAWILMIGGHYTYAEVPFGYWLRDTLGLARNPYDRIGHFAQGFVPALLAREIFIRKKIVEHSAWRFYIVTSVCLAFSAFYEFIEWWTAVIGGGAADSFLGTQGDVWDTQWDMFTAFCAAIIAQALLYRLHNRQISKIEIT